MMAEANSVRSCRNASSIIMCVRELFVGDGWCRWLFASQAALAYMHKRVRGNGGVVCLDMQGHPGIAHTTERMAWAHIREDPASREVSETSGMTREPEFEHIAKSRKPE
jgi:hypothetical protein